MGTKDKKENKINVVFFSCDSGSIFGYVPEIEAPAICFSTTRCDVIQDGFRPVRLKLLCLPERTARKLFDFKLFSFM